MIELLRARRSIREYAGRSVEPEKVALLKEAALRSPSSRSIDSWEFVFVDDRKLLAKLSRCKPHGADFLEGAALGIVVCGDSQASDVWVEDCSIAAILVQMTAQSMGLGTCWIQVRNRRFDDATTSEQHIQALLGIPPHIKAECIIAVGYPAERPEPLSGEDLKTCKIRENRWLTES
ncbi:MAG TPA: nitroreductase family protein [Sedimentisphaerales bacterium]|nr:nitroreductase family protein [Sedimentisphaerales bacterium]